MAHVPKKYLILGGAGLVGSAIAREAIKQREHVTVVDLPDRLVKAKLQSIKEVEYRGENILASDTLRSLFHTVQPDVVINAVNLATILSHDPVEGYQKLIKFYVSLYHTLANQRQPLHYIQMGTTGSGGLGFNIPFTHGDKIEDLPIIHKAAFSGIMTQLAAMLSRSFDPGMRISEIKPGLAIFDDTVRVTEFQGGRAITADGGESGHYTYAELALLTTSMGFTTVDAIAHKVFSVINESKSLRRLSSFDVTEALNSTIIAASKADEQKRNSLMKRMKEAQGDVYVIATGNLGPASITRDLIIAHALIHKLQVSIDEHFYSSLQIDPCIRATVTYINETNPELAKELAVECTYYRYQILAQKVKRAREAWQVVAN